MIQISLQLIDQLMWHECCAYLIYLADSDRQRLADSEGWLVPTRPHRRCSSALASARSAVATLIIAEGIAVAMEPPTWQGGQT